MNRCPSADDLRRLLADELARPEAEAIETHLENCAGCQQTLEDLTADAGPARRTPSDKGEGEFLRQLQQHLPTGVWPLREHPTRLEEGKGLSPPAGDRRGADHAAPAKLALVPGTGSRQIGELTNLLRKRLRFFVVVDWAGFAVYAASAVILAPDPVTLVLYGFMLALVGVLLLLLWSGRPLSLGSLRWIELIVFASTLMSFSCVQWMFYSWDWLSRVADDDWLALMLLARGMSFSWFALIAAYGLLIPNTWRRCATIVSVMAFWPVALNAALSLRDRPLATRMTFVVESGLNMAIAAALAIYGSHRIEALRRQALEARKVGPYQLKRRLGAGGMGEVYLGEHVLLRRCCAVKLIRPEKAGDSQSLRRFEREVQVMATLSHPNTVEIYDYGHAEDGTFYYVMEYLPGLNLEELVLRHGPLPQERVVHLLHQMCGALGEAHGVGLVHRDVKPSNILVGERGGLHDVAKLLDFGLVQVSVPAGQTLTMDGIIAGTPAYMSPEQAAGKADPDARSDLYSLGAVAYFLLTGQPPFVRATAVETLAAHLKEAVSSPPLQEAGVSADLQVIVLNCLEKEPARRFSDAEALDQALAQCAFASQWTRARAADWWLQHRGE